MNFFENWRKRYHDEVQIYKCLQYFVKPAILEVVEQMCSEVFDPFPKLHLLSLHLLLCDLEIFL